MIFGNAERLEGTTLRLIDADALRYHKQFRVGKPVEYLGKYDIMCAPTVEAAPVVHGRWENIRTENDVRYNSDGEEQNNYYQNATCSVCGEDGFPEWKACPSCAAKMDL